MKKKEISDKEFIITIMSELFAREIDFIRREGSLEKENLKAIYNTIHCNWDHRSYEKEIFKMTKEILKNEYDFDMDNIPFEQRKKI